MLTISTFYSIIDQHTGGEPCDTRHGNNRNDVLIMRNGNNRKSIAFRSLPASHHASVVSGCSRSVAPDWIKCLPPILHLMSVTPGPDICRYSPSMDHFGVTNTQKTYASSRYLGLILVTWECDSVTVALLLNSLMFGLHAGLRWKRDKPCHKSRDRSSLQLRWISGTQLVRGIWHGCDKLCTAYIHSLANWLNNKSFCPRVYKIVLSKQCSKCGWPIFLPSDAGLVGVTLFTKLVITFEIRPDHF